MATILIAGCGYVGTRLAFDLSGAGHRVYGLRRQPDDLPHGIEPFAADLTDSASLRSLPAALDYVVYTAAPDGPSDDAYQAVYVQGIQHLLQALTSAGQAPKRFLLTSSTSVFAQSGDEWVDETCATEPLGHNGRRVLEGEAITQQGPFPETILRLGGIYGPGRARLIDQVRAGQAPCGVKEPFTNRIHRDDAAGALAHLLFLREPQALYLGVDCQPVRRCEVLRWLAEQLGVPPPSIVSDSDAAARRDRRTSSKRCRNDRLLRSGYVFRYPTFRDGYADLLSQRSSA